MKYNLRNLKDLVRQLSPENARDHDDNQNNNENYHKNARVNARAKYIPDSFTTGECERKTGQH
jgi:hypothetical protein